MDLINQFIEEYKTKFAMYKDAAEQVKQRLADRLNEEGVRAIVSARAKAIERAESKARARAPSKEYPSVDDIFKDIVDLAGVRIALYFPGDVLRVESIIRDMFINPEVKRFPVREDVGRALQINQKRFDGYHAVHFRVLAARNDDKIAGSTDPTPPVEIQVASVLMHAWAEVEHDLVYKPMDGHLSETEYAILDSLNGLVLAGEIGLEQLQRFGAERNNKKNEKFENHYDLAAYILRTLGRRNHRAEDLALGRVDVLFDLLRQESLDAPAHLSGYLRKVHAGPGSAPISDQIIDILSAGNPGRFQRYRELLSAKSKTSPAAAAPEKKFLELWDQLERVARTLVSQICHSQSPSNKHFKGPELPLVDVLREIAGFGMISDENQGRLRWISEVRNRVAHSHTRLGDVGEIEDSTRALRKIVRQLKRRQAPGRAS